LILTIPEDAVDAGKSVEIGYLNQFVTRRRSASDLLNHVLRLSYILSLESGFGN
jgi:hypothetical protein